MTPCWPKHPEAVDLDGDGEIDYTPPQRAWAYYLRETLVRFFMFAVLFVVAMVVQVRLEEVRVEVLLCGQVL